MHKNISNKYGLKCIPLDSYEPNFVNDICNHSVFWHEADYIYPRIQSFLIHFARITFKSFSCYCCIYPTQTASSFIIFVDADDGSHRFLLSSSRDDCFRQKSWKFITALKDDLLLLDTADEALSLINREILCQLHPGG